MIQRQSILQFIEQPYHWGFTELRAQDMGENILECALIYSPSHCPFNFVAYKNVEFSGEVEQFIEQYGKPVNVAKFAEDFGPLEYVPKVRNEDHFVQLVESGAWVEFHIEHNEDFISPYTPEINKAITERMIDLYKGSHNLKELGMNPDLVNFLMFEDYEQEVGSEDELVMALSPFRNSINKLIDFPLINFSKLKLADQNKIEFEINLGVYTKYKDEDSIEIQCSASANIDHASKTLKISEIKEISTVVLSFDDDEDDFLIYGVKQWFADRYSELQFEYVFNNELFENKIREIMLSPLVAQKLAAEILV